MHMKRILAFSVLIILAACSKETTNSSLPNISYNGKWGVNQTVYKVYTVDNGDTTFNLNQVTNYGDSTAFITFNYNNKGVGTVDMDLDGQTQSYKYTSVSHAYFDLDSTICEITHLSDSAFNFYSTSFQNSADFPGKIQVTQNFYSLSR
jgi:hypothetical protein